MNVLQSEGRPRSLVRRAKLSTSRRFDRDAALGAAIRAEQLGLDDAVELLEETLDEEEATDEALTEIAQSAINQRPKRPNRSCAALA
jgi:hypothetical protein